jgi:hypothetical protein
MSDMSQEQIEIQQAQQIQDAIEEIKTAAAQKAQSEEEQSKLLITAQQIKQAQRELDLAQIQAAMEEQEKNRQKQREKQSGSRNIVIDAILESKNTLAEVIGKILREKFANKNIRIVTPNAAKPDTIQIVQDFPDQGSESRMLFQIDTIRDENREIEYHIDFGTEAELEDLGTVDVPYEQEAESEEAFDDYRMEMASSMLSSLRALSGRNTSVSLWGLSPRDVEKLCSQLSTVDQENVYVSKESSSKKSSSKKSSNNYVFFSESELISLRKYAQEVGSIKQNLRDALDQESSAYIPSSRM